MTEQDKFELWLSNQNWCAFKLEAIKSLRNPDFTLISDVMSSDTDPYTLPRNYDGVMSDEFIIVLLALFAGWMAKTANEETK